MTYEIVRGFARGRDVRSERRQLPFHQRRLSKEVVEVEPELMPLEAADDGERVSHADHDAAPEPADEPVDREDANGSLISSLRL